MTGFIVYKFIVSIETNGKKQSITSWNIDILLRARRIEQNEYIVDFRIISNTYFCDNDIQILIPFFGKYTIASLC